MAGALALVGVGGLVWIANDPQYWFPGAYAGKGPRGDEGPGGEKGPRGDKGPPGVSGDEDVSSRLDDLEGTVSDLESQLGDTSGVDDLSSRIDAVESSADETSSRVDDAEGRLDSVEGRVEDACSQLRSISTPSGVDAVHAALRNAAEGGEQERITIGSGSGSRSALKSSADLPFASAFAADAFEAIEYGFE